MIINYKPLPISTPIQSVSGSFHRDACPGKGTELCRQDWRQKVSPPRTGQYTISTNIAPIVSKPSSIDLGSSGNAKKICVGRESNPGPIEI